MEVIKINRNKLYWSVMGVEPQEKSVKREDFEKFEHSLKVMLGKYDNTEVLSLIKKVYEESQQ